MEKRPWHYDIRKVDGTTFKLSWVNNRDKMANIYHLDVAFRYTGSKIDWEELREEAYSRIRKMKPRFRTLIRVVEVPEPRNGKCYYKTKKQLVSISLCMRTFDYCTPDVVDWVFGYMLNVRDYLADRFELEVFK